MNKSQLPFGLLSRGVIGFISGLFVAGIFSAYATLMWLWNDRSLGWLDVTLGEVLLVYLLWGPLVGAVGGFVFPVTRTRVGAAAVGAFILGAAYALTWPITDGSFSIGVFFVLLGLAVGGVAGVIVFGRFWAKHEDSQREKHPPAA